MIRGGAWGDGAYAGVFSFNGYHSRAGVGWNVGFRSALVRYSGDSGDLDNLDSKEQPEAAEPAETLSGLVRLVLAHQLAELYKAAGGADPDSFLRKAYDADDKEIQKAAALAFPLSQVNTAVELYRNVSQQLKIANTLTLTIGKEAADHE